MSTLGMYEVGADRVFKAFCDLFETLCAGFSNYYEFNPEYDNPERKTHLIAKTTESSSSKSLLHYA